MPSAGFEPAIPAIEPRQTYALDGTATRITCMTFPGINYFFLWMEFEQKAVHGKLKFRSYVYCTAFVQF